MADHASTAPAGVPEPATVGLAEARFTYSDRFPEILVQAGASLLISTYQAGQLVAVGVADGRLTFSMHRVDQAMGVAALGDTIAVGARGQVWFLRDQSELAAQIEPRGRYDRCFLARRAVVTGGIQCHEVTWGVDATGEPELWLVNTLFSCLATLHPSYSFVPRWRPPFVTALAAEDRCHLNGLAMRDGAPAYVTVMAQSDAPGGWRSDRNDTGAVLDVASGEAVTTGLAMPHSPRWHGGHLFVLNSGLGRLEHVDLASGQRGVVALLPGYARGLALHGDLAFVGLSRIRETAIFGGAPIAAHHDQLRCGVGIIELSTGTTIATLQFASGIEEIFDVQVVPRARCLALGGAPPTRDGPAAEIWVVPEPGSLGAS